MPKAGVGSQKIWIFHIEFLVFQSIYAQSRRWKFDLGAERGGGHSGLNPFMPKAGVGSFSGSI